MYISSVHADNLYRHTQVGDLKLLVHTKSRTLCQKADQELGRRFMPSSAAARSAERATRDLADYVRGPGSQNDEQPYEASHYGLVPPKFRRRLTSSSMGPRTNLLSEDDGDYPRGKERAVGGRQAVIRARVRRQTKGTPGRARSLAFTWQLKPRPYLYLTSLGTRPKCLTGWACLLIGRIVIVDAKKSLRTVLWKKSGFSMRGHV
jgi:hypothetical protein